MIEGGSYAQAGNLLGFSDTTTKTTLIHLNLWFQNKTNSDPFATALNALADELDAATTLIDYQNRRQRLARWSIPPEHWQALTGSRCHIPPSRRGITDWGERKRRFASWIVWTTVTSGEHLFAPTSILPAVNGDQANLKTRRSLVHEWHNFQQRAWRHHAELAQIIRAYTDQTIREIDGQPE